MAKTDKIESEDGELLILFYCPGCGFYHSFRVRAGSRQPDYPVWEWNENGETPTFSPSLLVNKGTEQQCHLFLRDGKIEFLSDCHHGLKGQVVDLQNTDW